MDVFSLDKNAVSSLKFQALAESRAKIWCQSGAFGPPVAWAAVRSKAVVLLLLTFCLVLLPLWESVIVLRFVVRYFMSILEW